MAAVSTAPWSSRSATAMVETREVFFNCITVWLMNDGIMMRTAWGRMMLRKVWAWRMPNAPPAALPLAFAHRLDAAAEHLRVERPGVQRQREKAGHDRRQRHAREDRQRVV